jgi:SAM-dependent methyltransferase
MPEQDNWDRHWAQYAAAASRNPAQRMRHDIIVQLLRRTSGPRPRILDIGSGQGDLLVKLHRVLPQAELLGFELSASGVELSRQKLPVAKFLVADLFQPPETLATFAGWGTVAVCSEVLEHVDSPVDFLKAARIYLADEARLVVTVPGGPMSAFDRHIGHRQHFTRQSIARYLGEAGFEVERVYLSGFPFFNLYRCVVIARGESLAEDVSAGEGGFSARLADGVMAFFRILFRLNLLNSPFGWQVVAVARKAGRQNGGAG